MLSQGLKKGAPLGCAAQSQTRLMLRRIQG